ncbi:hypothetical protein [Cellulosimicrobium cellulans]|uniref:hypothetical protein n=1 Tax=Cellulosimicrobium cellulans TaxID=1710 RepID=UPI001BA9123A|nr:hypothetical protein [Cellulosimicrobium cellulans]QUC01099.1 hypothetical protein J5A69_07995 [Cellulosimicrobium cellulans]
MTASAHFRTFTVGLQRYTVLSGSLMKDETVIPYVQGDVTVPVTAENYAAIKALDPRTGPRGVLTLVQRFGESDPVSALTAELTGRTVADLTTTWDNWTAKNVSDTYGRPYNDFGMKPSTRLTGSLGIREVSIDYDSWTATVRLASDEARLMDTINTATVDRVPDDSTVREAVQMVLGYIGSFLQVDDGVDHNFRSDAGGWAPGQSAWSYVQPLVESAGLRLYCDETGRWHLVEQETSSTDVTRLQSAQVSSMNTRTDREGNWYDAVMIEYRWRDVSDVEHVVYDYAASTENPTRPRFIRRDRVWPGDGAAASILRRDKLSGARTQVSAVADYSVSTDGTLAVSFTSLGEVLAGDIESVQWFFDDDRMTVIAKDSTTDVNPTSWLIAPESYPWADVPAGIDWTEAGVLVETEA